MRGLALGVTIALTAASAAAAQDASFSKKTRAAALQDVVFAAPAGSRDWPTRLKVDAGRLGIGLAPRLAVSGDSEAEAGAEVRLSFRRKPTLTERLDEMGVRDGARFGETGRWYLFATASGRSVGLNMLRSEDGWSQAGWTTDPTSALIGDAQAGVGWRRGYLQASVGYMRRETRSRHAVLEGEGQSDSLVAFSLSLKP